MSKRHAAQRVHLDVADLVDLGDVSTSCDERRSAMVALRTCAAAAGWRRAAGAPRLGRRRRRRRR